MSKETLTNEIKFEDKTSSKSSKLHYRAEIDGLRAIAVISVIIYHAEMIIFERDWFEGGFIGVDIFFVISGYLITRIMLSELDKTGSFSFINFYERRARRILPLLFVVIFASIPFAWKFLLPSGLIEYAQSILASLFFGSNFFFFFSTTEYGADSALLKPFLHTWSLGVEEQFYLVFPVIAIIAFKISKKFFITALVALSLVSLQFSEIMEIRNSDLNFYLPFSRFWELAVGSILAYREINYKSDRDNFWTHILPTVGLYLICYSIFTFDSTTPHPAFPTIIPILGVALVIGFSSQDEIVGKVLGSKPFVSVGLISYSAYLWHFPIFAFGRISTSTPSNYDKLEWIALTFVLSIISYFIVEKPFRNRKLINTKVLWSMIIIALLAVCAMAAAAISNAGYKGRIAQGWINFEHDNQSLRQVHWKIIDNNLELLSKPDPDKINVFIYGNSHAVDFLDAMMIEKSHYKNYHFMKFRHHEQLICMDESDARFQSFRDKFYETEAYKGADIVVISTRYNNSKCGKVKPQTSNDFDGLDYLIPRLKKDGKAIIVVGNTLEVDSIDEKIVADYIYASAENQNTDFKSKSEFASWAQKASKLAYENIPQEKLKLNEKIKKYSQDNELLHFDRVKLFCNFESEDCIVFDEDGFKIRWDYGHLTAEGKEYMAKRLVEENFESYLEKSLSAQQK